MLLMSMSGGNTVEGNEMPGNIVDIKLLGFGVCEMNTNKRRNVWIKFDSYITGAVAADDVGSLFKLSGGEGESLAADTGFSGLMLNRGSKNRFRELFDLEVT